MMKAVTLLCVVLAFLLPSGTQAQQLDKSIGIYIGKYYDSEPAGFIEGRANYLEHYLFALTVSKELWRSSTLPIALEIDAMIGRQSGQATLGEVAIAPALRWGILPWRDVLRTDLRLAPIGISHTSSISPLERGENNQGSRTLSYLFIELALSRSASPAHEAFARLHHRCAIYDLINNYGANGEDFFSLGYRFKF